MNPFTRKASLSADFFLFSLLCFTGLMVVAVGFWVQVYNEALEERRIHLAEEAVRIDSVITDSMDYITQYAAFIGDKIVERGNPRDLHYIANLITGKNANRLQKHDFYFTTTFDWVTPDKQLRVSNHIGVLPEPFDMSDRDYLQRTPMHPWTLQLSQPRLGGLSREWILPAGVGITDREGKFLGSITLGFALKGLEQRIDAILGATDTRYLLLTKEGHLALDSAVDNATGPDPRFARILSGEDLRRLPAGYLAQPIGYNGAHYSHVRKLDPYPYIILSGYDANMAAMLFNDIVLSRSIGLLLVGLVVIGILYFMRRRIVTPVTKLAHAADRIRKGERVQIPESRLEEINLLGRELQKISEYIQLEQRVNTALNEKTVELEKATDEALKARDAAVKADQAKSEFLANMSHELRTPLNAIIGLTQVLLMKQFSPERLKEYLQTMHISAEQLLNLINDLLDLAKLESRHVELEHISFDLRTLVEEVTRIHALAAKEKKLHLLARLPEDGALAFMGDPVRLRQVLMNLVSNAVKFTEEGAVTVEVSRAPSAKPGTDDICISVTDTGIGIPPEKCVTIFDKFSQADTSITRRYGGTGLGLSISRMLVELMGGSLSVESAPGAGSRFTVRLALTQAGEALPETAEKHPFPGSPEEAACRVLVVEDNKHNMVVAASLLDIYGYPYTMVRDGRQAIEALEAEIYDIVLMDIQMPEMDGFEATRQIREREKQSGRPPVAIIGMTAFAMAGDRERCLNAGMNEYISKPFDPQALAALLKRFAQISARACDSKTASFA